MSQMLARRANALLGKAAPRVGSNRSAKLVVTCFHDGENSHQQADNPAQTPEEHTVEVKAEQEVEKAKITFQVPHHVEWGQDMCLVGEDASLGQWDVSKCVPMAWHEGDVWTAEAELPQGANVEYKYIIRGTLDEEVKEVVEWQPCWNLALTADTEEVTVRDHWEGDMHEVLPGTLPLPVLETPAPAVEIAAEAVPAPTAADDIPVSATDVVTAVPVVAAARAASPAPVIMDTPVDVEDLVTDQVYAPGEPGGAVAAEDLAAAELAAGFNAPSVPLRVLSGNGSKPHIVEVADDILAHNEVPNQGPHTPNYLADKTPKAMPTLDLANLATSELKSMCKARGLPSKGQRRDLLARLQQHSA